MKNKPQYGVHGSPSAKMPKPTGPSEVKKSTCAANEPKGSGRKGDGRGY